VVVSIDDVKKAGFSTLVEGVRVSYAVKPTKEGNPTAEKRSLIGM
jgi:cold shock CspA family protein